MRLRLARLAAQLLVRALRVLAPDDGVVTFSEVGGRPMVPLFDFGDKCIEISRLTEELSSMKG